MRKSKHNRRLNRVQRLRHGAHRTAVTHPPVVPGNFPFKYTFHAFLTSSSTSYPNSHDWKTGSLQRFGNPSKGSSWYCSSWRSRSRWRGPSCTWKTSLIAVEPLTTRVVRDLRSTSYIYSTSGSCDSSVARERSEPRTAPSSTA